MLFEDITFLLIDVRNNRNGGSHIMIRYGISIISLRHNATSPQSYPLLLPLLLYV